MATRAIYPGTFDPITNGHTDIIQRAARLFSHVIVAVAGSTSKTTAFSPDERVEMARLAVNGTPNVEVLRFDGLMTTFAREHDTRIIIRGLRAVSDFDYEFQMAGMNRQLLPDAETVFLTPAEHLSYISSSLLREIATYGGDVTRFVHPKVAAALKERLV